MLLRLHCKSFAWCFRNIQLTNQKIGDIKTSKKNNQFTWHEFIYIYIWSLRKHPKHLAYEKSCLFFFNFAFFPYKFPLAKIPGPHILDPFFFKNPRIATGSGETCATLSWCFLHQLWCCGCLKGLSYLGCACRIPGGGGKGGGKMEAINLEKAQHIYIYTRNNSWV